MSSDVDTVIKLARQSAMSPANVYPILKDPSPILRENVMNGPYVITRHIIDSLFATMRANNGAGLAAPQIGLPFPIFVTYWGEVFVRPVVGECGGGYLFWKNEGCLSLPGRTYHVQRFAQVEINGFIYTDNQARVIQHEADHLLGILIDKRGILVDPLREGEVGGK